jgi:hypothetical protein
VIANKKQGGLMVGIFGLFKLKTLLALCLIVGIFYLFYLFVPGVRQSAEEASAGLRMATSAVGFGTSSDSSEIHKINMERLAENQPHYFYVPDAYLNKSSSSGGFNGEQLNIIVSYPSFNSRNLAAPNDKYAITLRIFLTNKYSTQKDFYIKKYDLIVAEPDEKIGNLYGYIKGRGPPLDRSSIGLRVGDDKWFYLDKATQTFARLTCTGGYDPKTDSNDPNNYASCISSFLIDDKYSVLTSIPGPMIRQAGEFIDGLKQFLKSLEVVP